MRFLIIITVLFVQSLSGVNSNEVSFPGTKWCGLVRAPSNFDDLGQERATDMCCRTLVKCDRAIPPFTRKYYYFNFRPCTISDCQCVRT